jgi:monoamine oxidase
MVSDVEVAVIGAGAAGIAAGQALAAAGVTYVMLEASGRLGGRALTDYSLGYPVDLGCTWLHSADQNVLADAPPEQFGRDAGRSAIYLDDQKRWATAAEDADCRAYLDACEARLLAAGKRGEDPPASIVYDRASPYRRHFEWWCGAYTSVPAAEVGALDWYRYRDTETSWTVPTGYGRWIVKRAAGLTVRRECPVLSVDFAGRDVRLSTPAGILRAKAVVLTASTNALGRIRFAPGLPLAKQEALARLPLGHVNKVALRFDALDPDWPSARSAVLSVRIGRYGRPIAEVFVDATTARTLEPSGEAAQIDFVLRQFANMYGSGVCNRVKAARASTWGTAPWIWGGYAAMTPGGGDPRAVLAEPVADRLFFAGEAAHPHFFSTAHGAWESGQRAAAEAIRALS